MWEGRKEEEERTTPTHPLCARPLLPQPPLQDRQTRVAERVPHLHIPRAPLLGCTRRCGPRTRPRTQTKRLPTASRRSSRGRSGGASTRVLIRCPCVAKDASEGALRIDSSPVGVTSTSGAKRSSPTCATTAFPGSMSATHAITTLPARASTVRRVTWSKAWCGARRSERQPAIREGNRPSADMCVGAGLWGWMGRGVVYCGMTAHACLFATSTRTCCAGCSLNSPRVTLGEL